MKTQDSNIYQVLDKPDHVYEIPNYQRSYNWSTKNTDEFLADLETCKDKGEQHFFGCLVLNAGFDTTQIIDGQQRITASLLMIIAIFHLAEENKSLSSEDPSYISEKFLANRHKTENYRLKLRVSTADAEVFEKIYDNALNTEIKNTNLYRSYKYFKTEFQKKIQQDGDIDLYLYIKALSKFIISVILIEKDDDPQRIFESINAKGMVLGDGDRIRNCALMLSDSKLSEHIWKKYWKKIDGELVDIYNERDDTTEFFKFFCINFSKSAISNQQIYSKFKDIYNNNLPKPLDQQKVGKFYSQIMRELNRYVFLKYNKDETGVFKDFEKSAVKLNALNVQLLKPFLMKVLECFQDKKLSARNVLDIFGITESYLVRRIILGKSTASLDRFFYIMHQKIENRDEKNSYVDRYKSILLEADENDQKWFPNNHKVEEAILNQGFYDRIATKTQRFILLVCNDSIQPKESQFLSDLNERTPSIEHIMPQEISASKEWQEDLGQDWRKIHEEYCHRLCNLTLTGENSKYGNKSFNEKLNMENGFKQSSLNLNKFVADQTVWNKEVMDQRAKWWCEKINQIWSYPNNH